MDKKIYWFFFLVLKFIFFSKYYCITFEINISRDLHFCINRLDVIFNNYLEKQFYRQTFTAQIKRSRIESDEEKMKKQGQH